MRRKTNQWRHTQRATVGASDGGAALGLDAYKTPPDVFDQLVAEMEGEPLPEQDEPSPDMLRGILLEPIARKRLGQVLGEKIRAHPQSQFMRHPDWPHAHCLPDAWIGDDPVELKVPRARNWRLLQLYGMTPVYEIQVQMTLAITARPAGHFGSFNPETMEIIHQYIERDDGLIEQIHKGTARIYALAQERVRPREDEEAPQLDIPNRGGLVTIVNDADAVAAAETWRKAKRIIDAASETQAAATARLLSYGVGLEAFEVPGIVRYRRQNGSRHFDREAYLKAHPDQKDEIEKFRKRGKPFWKPYALKEEE